MEELRPQFTVENVESILHQFYHDAQSQAQANQFLMMAQLSPEAWHFAWQLLDRTKSHEAQFFGASTLQAKIMKQWNEVPGDQYETLRVKLLQAIFNYTDGPKFILTRLCVAMSSFVMQTITNFWPSAVTDLMSAFQPQNVPNANPHQLAHVLLEMLTVLCEELHTTHLSQSKSHAVRHALQTSFQNVMSLIESVLSKTSAPMDVCEMALKCYSSWSQLGSVALEYQPLMELTFDAVYRDDLCHTALETLSNIALHPCTHKFPNVILLLVENAAKFDTLLQEAIQNKSENKLSSIYGMILSVLENHTRFLLKTILEMPEKQDTILKLVNFALQCSAAPGQFPTDERYSEQAFGFWYALQDGIVSADVAVDPPKFEKLLLIFHGVFQSLLDAYMIKVQCPHEDAYKQWNSDEQESFRCYRQDVGDSMVFCYNVLRQGALANLISHLQIATVNATVDPNQWQYLESCLFAFKEVAESISSEEQCYIPQFMSQLPGIPLTNQRVVSSMMESIGAYADWINKHPSVLVFVVPLLLMGLETADIAPSATFALKDITRDCHISLRPYAQQILSASHDALSNNIIKSRERVRLMCSIGHVLSVMSYSEIMSFLDTLVTPMIERLEKLIMEEPNPNLKAEIVLYLHMFTMLFSTLDIKPDLNKDSDEEPLSTSKKRYPPSSSKEKGDMPQPVSLILQRVMPLFSALAMRWDPSEQIIEALCDALKRSLSTLLDDSKPFIPDMINLILHLYKCLPHTAALDMAKQILLLFHDDESERGQLLSFFADISNYTLELSQRDFRENTSVLEIFFQLLTQVLRKAFIFFRNDALNLPLLFQCGTAALALPEKCTVKSASSFITEFIIRSRESPDMLDVINNQGQALVVQVLKVIGGESPRQVVEFMPDILLALNRKYFDNLCRWMNTFSQDDSFLPTLVSQQQREQFTRLILKERTNKRKLKETVNEFGLLCRGLIGTEYAAAEY